MPATAAAEPLPDRAILAFLERAGLVGDAAAARFRPLAGGVSSDIWLVETGRGAFCVKRALEKLKVAADWRAPVERSRFEAAWFEGVGRSVPEAAPKILAKDADAGMFAMSWLAPDAHPLWKAELLAGRVEPACAARVGVQLARIHAAFARDPDAPATFATDPIFHAIRLEPYLLATVRAHPDRAAALEGLAARTAATKRTVIHGDVSPKNILIGPDGPVFLDAECACHGDPAFDLAFCLNHLLLKGLWVPAKKQAYLRCFHALAASYLSGVDWEDRAAFEERAAALLPGLLLGRVDGKSPVEYLQDNRDKDRVRLVARAFLEQRPRHLGAIGEAWQHSL
jgi:aminoglycoside phosphotransferase (APT) family kinase protein